METVHERSRVLAERYSSEYGCPVIYADEIAEGILDNFAVSYKTPPEGPQRAGNSSRCVSGGDQNQIDTRQTQTPVSSCFPLWVR